MPLTVTLMVVLATTLVVSRPAGSDDAAVLRVVAVNEAAGSSFEVIVAVPRNLSAETIGSDAFTATSGKEALDLEATPLPDDRLDIAVVLDRSLLQPQARTGAIGAAAEFVVGLPAGARIAIGGAGSPPGRQGVLTRDRGATLSALGALEPGGVGGADVRAAWDVLRSDPHRRPALVLVTAEPATSVQAELGVSSLGDLPVYAIVVDQSRAGLVQTALPGDGVMLITGAQKLIASFDIVTADLTGQYRLRFRLPERAPRTVALRVAWHGVLASNTVTLDDRGPGRSGIGTAAAGRASDEGSSDAQREGRGWVPWLMGAGAMSIAAALAAGHQLQLGPAAAVSRASKGRFEPPPRIPSRRS
jgi:hypothetical protein